MGVIRTIELSDEEAEVERQLLESGVCASPQAIFMAGVQALAEEAMLKTLPENEAAIDRWIRDEVDPLADRMMAEPGIPAEQVFAELRARYAGQLGKG